MDYGSSEHLLVQLGTPGAMSTLFERIEQGTSIEGANAISAIAGAGAAEHVERLLRIARTTDDPALEQQILNAAVYSESVDLQQVADQALNHDSPEMRYTAVQALTRLGTDNARSKLLELVQDDNTETRHAALSAMAQIGGDDAERVLIDALEDPDVAWAAVGGLQQLGTPAARDAIVNAARGNAPAEVRASVLHQVASMGGVDSVGILADAAADEDLAVRQSAVSALGSLGTTSAAEQLGKLLDDDRLDESERQMAAGALQRLGGPIAAQYADQIESLMPEPGGLDTGVPIHVEP